MKTKSGFTLIELAIFIVVMGILASLLTKSYLTMLKHSPKINSQLDASQTASKCMGWFIGQRFINGFSSIALGANIPGFCNVALPTGYNIATNVSNFNYNGDTTNYKIITVTVTGNTTDTSSSKATLSTIIANY